MKLRIVARNSLGYGNPSEPIELVPSTRPSAPGPVLVTTYGGDYLELQWAAPTDTGANDALTLPLTRYMLEVDEQFGQGFVTLFEFDADIDGPFASVMAFTHSNLILGHPYQYRVKAENLMGYGVYSSIAQSYIPRQIPGKPPTAPVLVPELSDRTELVIQYAAITENTGGSPILQYSVYVDDGLDGPFSGPYVSMGSGMTMRFSTNLLPTSPVTGRIYRFKYTATNIAGESELSDELSVLLAEVPSTPLNLHRIDSATLPAG